VTQINGSTAEIQDVRDWPMKSGRYFDAVEAASRNKVAIIGSTVARELFGEADPVGTTVRMNNVPFQVIGVLTTKGQAGGRDQDDVVIVPLATARSRLMGRIRVPDEVGQILVKVDDRYDIAETQADLERVLRQRRRIGPSASDNFMVRNFAEFLATRSATQRTLSLLLASAAAISLIVGGIGIMNIMLVSVTERTREIGLRMAIGARGSDILGQFLTEAVLLCLAGGFIGLTLGVGISVVVSMLFDWPVYISPAIVFVAILASASVGVLFGYVPARRASQLNPIEALRYE
jgi:putative ABC transport system permease protein